MDIIRWLHQATEACALLNDSRQLQNSAIIDGVSKPQWGDRCFLYSQAQACAMETRRVGWVWGFAHLIVRDRKLDRPTSDRPLPISTRVCWLLRFVLQSLLSEVWSLEKPRHRVGISAHAGTRPRACLQLLARVSQRESR
eukprot:3554733-Amphidinium_carterae.1